MTQLNPPPLPEDTAPRVAPPKPPATIQAARLSALSPLMVLVIGAINRFSPPVSPQNQHTLNLFGFVFIALGLLLGVFALAGIPRHGSKRILRPALIGIVLNGLIVLAIILPGLL